MHQLARYRFSILAAICAFWAAVVLLGLQFRFSDALWRGEQSFQDSLEREGRKTKTHSEFVFLGIDQSTLQLPPLTPDELASNRAFQLMTERPFPWSREVWALLLDRLFGAGARVVMFDMVFDKPGDGDPAFHVALDRYHDKVVIGANFDFSAVQEISDAAINVAPNTALIPAPQMEDNRVGYVVFFPEPLALFPDSFDQKLRSIRYTITNSQLARQLPRPGEKPYESLAARALEKLGRGQDVPRDLQMHAIRFSAPDAFPPRSLYEVFDPKLWHSNYADGAFFKDKLVIIGSSAQIAHDVFPTPLAADTPGAALHLHAIAAALEHEFLRAAPAGVGYAFLCGAGTLAWVLVAFLRRPLLCLIALLVAAAIYLGLARLLYDWRGLFILVVPTLAVFLLGGLFSLGFDFALERIQRVRTRRTLERYVSRNLVNEILENPTVYLDTLRGVRKPVVVLFSDIADFTTISEKTEPEALVRQLNEYLSAMTAVVFEHGGTLDKFIGDAVMAVWGNVHSEGATEDARAAARAALAMRKSLRALNEQWRADGVEEFKSGIGLNHGEVVVGNIGSEQKMDFTVVGDAVNLASRIEALTRIYPADILVGPDVRDLLRHDFYLRSVGLAQVKGKMKAVEIFGLIGARNDGDVDPDFVRRLELYEEGIQRFREREFAKAQVLFSRFLEFYPEDELTKLYVSRILEYEQYPPGETWNAVEVFTKK
jgi:adenylate cyclase